MKVSACTVHVSLSTCPPYVHKYTTIIARQQSHKRATTKFLKRLEEDGRNLFFWQNSDDADFLKFKPSSKVVEYLEWRVWGNTTDSPFDADNDFRMKERPSPTTPIVIKRGTLFFSLVGLKQKKNRKIAKKHKKTKKNKKK